MQQEPGSRVGDTRGEVADRVRQVIDAVGVSQREFARRIVMDPSKLSRSLSGARRFTVAELARVADTGDVDAAWLLGSAGGPGGGTGSGPSAGQPAPAGRRRSAAPAAPTDGGRPLQIVRETVRLIAERGFHAVRVSDIAEACATSTAAIHYHFPGRDDLLEAAVRWCMDEDTARRAARTAEAVDVADELRQLIELQTPHTRQRRRQWSVWLDLWAEAARSTAVGRLHVEYYRQWRATVADVIRRGVAEGVFRPVDPETAALTLTALIDGLASQVLAGTPGESGTSADDMLEALLTHVDTTLIAR
ncbi:TetR family transcriptional regulator C-terminal domain-containing protein [Streptomyces monticola]|uniref:TetR family transcriptional regulator C-terminal domain-containing protein n=1 Tax=Streptomyces monticola TaxID=2666263 RepID=A0ABW2JQV8_9ACTN